jgi:GLPGLI family protein
MRLDYVDGVSMFYDGFTYERDSLRMLAFGEDGKIKDQEEYNKLRSLPRQRFDDFTIVDFKSSEIIQLFGQATITIRGTMKMSVPDWKLSEESCVINGFSCKKATADYLGRNWIVWYTEDIPLPIGPWMLWGTPGLIVSAQDSEELFSFQLVWADKLDNYNRAAFIDSLYPDKPFQKGGNTKHYVFPMKEAEKMYTRLRTDVSYLFEVTGVHSNSIDKLQKKAKKYIPLIPSDYWKDK